MLSAQVKDRMSRYENERQRELCYARDVKEQDESDLLEDKKKADMKRKMVKQTQKFLKKQMAEKSNRENDELNKTEMLLNKQFLERMRDGSRE